MEMEPWKSKYFFLCLRPQIMAAARNFYSLNFLYEYPFLFSTAPFYNVLIIVWQWAISQCDFFIFLDFAVVITIALFEKRVCKRPYNFHFLVFIFRFHFLVLIFTLEYRHNITVFIFLIFI